MREKYSQTHSRYQVSNISNTLWNSFKAIKKQEILTENVQRTTSNSHTHTQMANKHYENTYNLTELKEIQILKMVTSTSLSD
jgi:hypothetical protein